MHKIYTTNYTETKTPATPWLEPATLYPAEQQQNIFNNEINKLEISNLYKQTENFHFIKKIYKTNLACNASCKT